MSKVLSIEGEQQRCSSRARFKFSSSEDLFHQLFHVGQFLRTYKSSSRMNVFLLSLLSIQHKILEYFSGINSRKSQRELSIKCHSDVSAACPIHKTILYTCIMQTVPYLRQRLLKIFLEVPNPYARYMYIKIRQSNISKGR